MSVVADRRSFHQPIPYQGYWPMRVFEISVLTANQRLIASEHQAWSARCLVTEARWAVLNNINKSRSLTCRHIAMFSQWLQTETQTLTVPTHCHVLQWLQTGTQTLTVPTHCTVNTCGEDSNIAQCLSQLFLLYDLSSNRSFYI